MLFQVDDEDEELVPEATTEGFQFGENSQVPNEGFKFWRCVPGPVSELNNNKFLSNFYEIVG